MPLKKTGEYQENPDSYIMTGEWFDHPKGVDGNWDTWQYAYAGCFPCYLFVNYTMLEDNFLWEVKHGQNSTIDYLRYNITIPPECRNTILQLGFEIRRRAATGGYANSTPICYDYLNEELIKIGTIITSQAAYASPRADKIYEEAIWWFTEDYVYFQTQKESFLTGSINFDTFISNANQWVT